VTDDLLVNSTKSGTSIINEGDAFAGGSKGVGLVGTGDRISITNNGTLGTAGNAGHAISVYGHDGTLLNNGEIKTSGISPDGLHAEGNRNQLVNAGIIKSGPAGDFVAGLAALGNNNRLLNTGTLLIEGYNSSGLRTFGDGNALTNNAAITTSGASSTGMTIFGTGNSLVNAGTITVTGKESAGILSNRINPGEKDFSNSNTLINRGKILVSGENSYGVHTFMSGRMTVVNEASGVIESRKDAAIKFDNNTFNIGNDRVENFGRISNLSGGVAVDLGTGDDTFLIGSTSQIDGAVEAGAGFDTFTLSGSTDGALDLDRSAVRSFELHEKIGTSTWTISGTNDRVMPWEIREGGLMITGTLKDASMNVHDGATLGGTGTVGSITARSGSTLSPGMNGIGSLAVTGNVLIANGTTYRIDLNAGKQSDRIVAQGSAKIEGGTVRVAALPGDYRPGSRWTILTAQGGVTGQFSNVTTNFAFFKPVLTKDGKNVYLALAATPNPAAGDRPVIDPFLPVSNDDLPRVLDLTSGEPLVSATTAILAHDDLFRAAVLCRMRCSEGMPGFAMADYAADMPVSKGTAAPVAVRLPQRDWAMWAKAIGSWGSTDASAVSHGMERSTAGLVFGVDAGLGTPYRLGLAAGYFSTDLSMGSLGASGNVESLHIGAYGSASFDRLNLRGGLAYAHHEVDMTRSFAFTGFSGTMRSGSGVDSLQAFGEIGYEIPLSENVILEPFAGLAHVHIASRGVLEEGSVVAVTGDVHSFDTTYTTLGARLIATIPTERGNLTFKGLLGWRHAFGDVVPKATFSYVGDGRPFMISGAPIDKDSLVMEAGLNWEVSKKVTLNVTYAGTMGRRDQEHTVRAGLNIRF
ncbi:MAG: autotransporter outer rane beta-barrel protein, partial [Microvirga sp.]|nr:autotransporter outer rane beta-barrel protein [Microvirga sp.]